MRMFGFAGVGKTTLAREVANKLGYGVVFMAPTGKAALVLKKKGCDNACTAHSAIYKAVEDGYSGKVSYKLNPESVVSVAKLVILDEGSMADDVVGKDLESFGVKILVLADPFQLPPVNGDGYFTRAAPDIMLTEIHRQAADSPIIRMSMDIREGRRLKPGRYGDSVVCRRMDIDKEELRNHVMAADQLIVGKNKTRTTFNHRIRQLYGINSDVPVKDDRLICLKNNRTKMLLNGGIWTAQSVELIGSRVYMKVSTTDDPDIVTPVDVETPIEFFQGKEKELDWRILKRVDHFDFGYAITAHKSQGSQWDDVTVYDESDVFRENAARHLYTAVTRAAERVTVIID